ncbi:hypothetical protein [Aurantimonas sp. VKM B-3413]|uniref:hypothetical protein n=1 Tax=Aurantimonas sp. VKM B-3413 TaxID=2779401 RepID=UPI001E372740|nr:hypothetical protein [Aurantimonas sp. VKM B-3413]MCB8837754.1 hypothetical protein [Aurantimonas sp. VKM B-3413]
MTRSDMKPGPRLIIPTTAGPVVIRGVRRRPRLPASYMAIAGDFRPLALSGDYDRFVNGPLRQVAPDLPAVELSLDGDLDCGRSWELPVLIAHCLELAGLLDEATPTLVWATGMVDADLDPLPAEYHLPMKLALSEALFSEARARDERIVMVVPPPLTPAEREVVEAFARRYGAELMIAERLADVFAAFDLPLPGDAGEKLPALAGGAETGADAAEPDGRGRRLSRIPTLIALSLLAVTGSAGLAYLVFSSGLSTEPTNPGHPPERAEFAAGPVLSVDGLYAEDRAACKERIFYGRPLTTEPALQGADGLVVASRPGLCGLRFRNLADGPRALTLDPRLAGLGIPGNASLVSDTDLGAGETTIFFFSRSPQDLDAQAVLRDAASGREDRVTIRIQ